MIRDFSSVLCSYFVVVLCLSGIVRMLPDFSVCLVKLSLKTLMKADIFIWSSRLLLNPPPMTSPKCRAGDGGYSEVTRSHKDEPPLPVFLVMLLWVTKYFYICVYVYMHIFTLLILSSHSKPVTGNFSIFHGQSKLDLITLTYSKSIFPTPITQLQRRSLANIGSVRVLKKRFWGFL